MSRPGSVKAFLPLRLIADGNQRFVVRTEFAYEAADPYAVRVSFQTGDADDPTIVEWMFARELLAGGLKEATGEGDVKLWPHRSGGIRVVSLSLSSPTGNAHFEIPARELGEFLDKTYQVVPQQRESKYVDMDSELARLLGQA